MEEAVIVQRVVREGWLKKLFQTFACLCRSKCSVHEEQLDDILPNIESLIETITEKVIERMQHKVTIV